MTLLLGIDEGTSAVKAVLYDADLRPVAQARREKRLVYPHAGWVEQDPEEVLGAVVAAVGDVLTGATEPVTACGLDHQGESVLAWDADTGRPLTPIVTWQDKRSQTVLDRLGAGFATDPSIASRTQLGAPRWDPVLLDLFGVPAAVLPAIADTAGDLGVLRHESWSQELPLRARCVDQQAALAGASPV